MTNAQPPKYALEETARRGREIYLRDVLPVVAETHHGQYAAIDIETGAYELNANDYLAAEKLLTQQPNAQIWLERVGFPAARRMAGSRPTAKDAAS